MALLPARRSQTLARQADRTILLQRVTLIEFQDKQTTSQWHRAASQSSSERLVRPDRLHRLQTTAEPPDERVQHYEMVLSVRRA